MKDHHTRHLLKNVCALILATTVLSACLSDSASEDVAEVDTENQVSGSVGDGPVVGATVRIMRNDGTELAQEESDASANYNLVVRTQGKYYPLSVESQNGTDLVTSSSPDFDLLSAVLEPGKKTVANINPFSTLAVELARDMSGGENKTNLATAEATVAAQFNSGLSSLQVSGPMTTPISAANIAEIVRASEALGETVRRTRNAVSATGFDTSGNSVVRALASDLTDNVVDGLGGRRTNARLAATSTVVAAQVLLETMANELHVNGVDATAAMQSAIEQVMTSTADPALENLTTTADMLSRTRIGLDAAYVVSGDPLIGELHALVKDMQPGTSSLLLRTLVLPADYRGRLNNVILLVAGGDAGVHETVNAISRNGGSGEVPSGSTNTPPTISGSPATSVVAGTAYSFTPNATDVDGDVLSFSVSNAPSWATFDAGSGRLSGTPADTDAGSYANIAISVSDGLATASLPAFTITVTTAAPTNQAPQISGTPPTSVLVGNAYSFTPSASDADGDALTFSISGLPGWASFSSATGELSGTPDVGDIGTYPNIRIAVSDGLAGDALPEFTLTVEAVALGSVTLKLTAPTSNTDGSPLLDLAGFNIYWGTVVGNYPNRMTINNTGVSDIVVDNLAPGTYQFVATAFTTSGIESVYSGVVERTVSP